MKQILPIILVLIAVAGAGFAAKTLRGGPETPVEAHAPEEGDIHEVKDDHSAGAKNPGYFRFNRDFIVPVMRGNTVDSLVLLRLSIEMEADKVETFRPKEPRIRDGLMQTLLRLSHEGLFSGDITAPAVYETIQSRLLQSAMETMDGEPKEILLVDFARQDQ